MVNLQEYSPEYLYLLYSKYTKGANNSAGGGAFCDSYHACDNILSEGLKMSAEDTFSVVKERIDKFDLSQTHTPEEWQSYFDDGIFVLDHVDYEMKEHALERIQKGMWSENNQHFDQGDFNAATAARRLQPVLEAILQQQEKERCLIRFTMWSLFSEEQKEFFSQWVNQAEANGSISAVTAATARIQAELYPKEDWNLAKSFWEPFFDHPNDLLRAASGAALGAMCLDGAINLPELGMVLMAVKEREIARPGFAGAFLGQLQTDSAAIAEIEESGVNLSDWILEIISKRSTDEPCVPYYNGIDFYAHEILSTNPEAVRKLIDSGAESVAAMAATEEDRCIDGMQVLLEELALSADEFVSRICCWHLAGQYRFLHPEGERRGYVQLEEREDVDIFLVFDPEELDDRPYVATIYPKESALTGSTFLTDGVAWKWIDRLVPPELRPPMKDNDWPYKTPQIDSDSAMYVYGEYVVDLFGDAETKRWSHVWVKWPLRSSEW